MTMLPLTEDDRARLCAITTAAGERRDPQLITLMLRTYYADVDRADRTPREVLYLHLGLMSGLIERMALRGKD